MKSITRADIEANIAREFYFTGTHGVLGESEMGTRPTGIASGLDQLTFCVIVLRNGTKIVGINHGSIDPVQHDPSRGKVEARAHAIEQIWPLMGYELRTKMANAPKPNAVDPLCVFRYCPNDDDCKARGRCVNRS